MANKRLLLRRGTASQNNAFTGADGEITYDTEGKNLRLHDGVTAGGTTLSSGAQPAGSTNTVQTTDGSGNLTDSGVTINDAVISSTSSTFAIGTASNRADGFFDVVDISGETLSVSNGKLQLAGEDILTSSDLVTATTQTSGIVQLSTPTQASTGSDYSTAMTPALVRQEIDSRVNVALTSAVQYKGTFTSSTEWDADSDGNADSTAINEGDLYYFSGTEPANVFGVTFNTGDHLIWGESITAGSLIDSTKFDKIDNTDSVSSVNGSVGAVSIDLSSALSEGSSVASAHTLTFSNSSSALVINKVQSNLNADLELNSNGTGDVTLVGDGTNVGSLRFNCENNTFGHDITIYSPDHTAFASAGGGYDLTLPAASPTDGQVLTSTSNGTLSWGTPSAGVTSLEALSDTYTTSSTLSLADGHVLQYNGDTGKWENAVLDVTSDSFAYEHITTAPSTLSVSDKTSKLFTLNVSGTYQLPAPTSANSGTTVVIKAETQPINIQSASGIVLLSSATTTTTTTNPVLVTQVMSFVSTGSSWIQTSIEENDLGSLSDVGVTTLATNDFLTYNGTTWGNVTTSNSLKALLEAGTSTTNNRIIVNDGAYANGIYANGKIQAAGEVISYAGLRAGTNDGIFIKRDTTNAANGFITITQPSSQTSSYTLTLPDSTPTTNGDVLSSTTAGTLSWVTPSSGGGASAPSVFTSSDFAAGTASHTLNSPTGIEEVYVLTPTVNQTIILPQASTCGAGYKYNIKNKSTFTLTIDGNLSETIDDVATFDLSVQNSSITIVCDGSNWHII